ncbi:hypothetical protein [Carnobacterium funditum]|uniref:hypothetical protein n=1 Tax=Carnobacterium funditum TaxID=2752 RepID=UPI00055495C0|nr:hypothetical protein [Carnobacterium funditum]
MENKELYSQVEVFLKDIMLLHDLPKKHSKLLFELWIMSKSRTKLVLNSYVKSKLANKLKITVGTLNNILTKMIEEKLIFKTNKGTYQVSSLLDEINVISNQGYAELRIMYQIGKKKIIINEDQ